MCDRRFPQRSDTGLWKDHDKTRELRLLIFVDALERWGRADHNLARFQGSLVNDRQGLSFLWRPKVQASVAEELPGSCNDMCSVVPLAPMLGTVDVNYMLLARSQLDDFFPSTTTLLGLAIRTIKTDHMLHLTACFPSVPSGRTRIRPPLEMVPGAV